MGGLSCRLRRSVDPDEAWKQQNKEQNVNPVYDFASLGGGGRLVTAFEKGGVKAVLQIVTTEFGPFLYNGGRGHMVSRVEWGKWAAAKEAEIIGDATLERRQNDVIQEFEDKSYNEVADQHLCNWRLDKRGGVGETPLHILLLQDSDKHRKIVRAILKVYPKLAHDIFEADEYFGESGLHIAIVFGDIASIKNLVEIGTNVNARATGRFFLPEDVKTNKKKKSKDTDYSGHAYFGEYPLAFAAALGNQEIYEYLLASGANPNLQDSFGNTVLHLIVLYEKKEMYRYAVKHTFRPANPHVKNNAGLTPLQLASKLGKAKIFHEMLELASIELWRYSNITCSVFPLSSIDTISPNGETNWNSALMYIINGETDAHLDMLENGVVWQLLQEKWKVFARHQFFLRLFLCLLHLLLLTVAIYCRPTGTDDPLMGTTDTISIVRYVCESIVCIGSGGMLATQIGEIRTQGMRGFLRNCKSAPAKTINLVSNVLVLMCIPFRFLELVAIEETLLIFAVPGSWMFLLFFARGVFTFGPFVIMIYRMLANDVVRFSIIIVIIFAVFTQSFYFLFKDIEDQNVKTFDTPQGTMMSLFQMTLGEFKRSSKKEFVSFKYDEFDAAHYGDLTKLIFAIFMIFVPILLLNMLIAMMGNTYQTVIAKSQKEWRRQWAKIVIVLERAYTEKGLKAYQQEYTIKLTDAPPGILSDEDLKKGLEHRALMVIKAAPKTRARQRKDAVNNWKRVYRSTRRLITKTKERKKWREGMPIEDMIEKKDDEEGKAAKGIGAALEQLAWERDMTIGAGAAASRKPSKNKPPDPKEVSPTHTRPSENGTDSGFGRDSAGISTDKEDDMDFDIAYIMQSVPPTGDSPQHRPAGQPSGGSRPDGNNAPSPQQGVVTPSLTRSRTGVRARSGLSSAVSSTGNRRQGQSSAVSRRQGGPGGGAPPKSSWK